MMRWLEVLAVGVYTFQLTGSPLMVALITIARFLPVMFFGAFAGAIAEQLNRRLLLLTGLAVLAATALTLGLLAWYDAIRLWHIAAGAVVSGIYFSGEFPVRRTMLGEIAGPRGIGTAMTLDSATNHTMRVFGPALGGLIFQTIGLHGVYFVGAAMFAVGFLLILRLPAGAGGHGGGSLRVLTQIREGLAFVRSQPHLLATLCVTMIANVFGFPFATMVPVIGREVLDLSAFRIGTLQSAEGAGALLGAVAIASLVRPSMYVRLYVGGTALFLAGVFAFALSADYGASLAILFIAGLGVSGFSAMQSTIVFAAAPAEMRSRVMGVLAVCIGTGPVGMLHLGLLADWLGAPLALRIAAAEGLVALLVVLLVWRRLRR